MKEKDYDLSTRCVHVAVLESPLWPQGDHDRLFVAGGHWGALVVVPRHMDDSEIDLRLDLPRAGSQRVRRLQSTAIARIPKTICLQCDLSWGGGRMAWRT